jgi:spore germination protein KC
LLSTAPVQIQYRPQNGVDNFIVKLKLEANLVSIQSGIDYTKPKLEVFLGRVIAEELKNRIVKVIKKAQQEFNSDVFGFGEKVRGTFITSTEYENYRWPDKFQHSQINVQVQVNLRRVGVQFQPPENR